jgi:GxxExxY protein
MNTYHGDTEARRNIGLLYEALTGSIIGAAIEVHRQLGPGLLESVYGECLGQEFRLRDIPFQAQVELPVVYKGLATGGKYRIDLIVANEVVVELKAGKAAQRARSTTLELFKGYRKARRSDHQLQRRSASSGHFTANPMTCEFLRASVSPWWVFLLRSRDA